MVEMGPTIRGGVSVTLGGPVLALFVIMVAKLVENFRCW